MKNAMVLLLLSAGVPMLVAGDEFAQTQGGNNNPYNQDNETTWLDWDRAAAFTELAAFVRGLIVLRTAHGHGPVELFGVGPEPDLGWTSHSLAWRRGDLYVMANAWWEPLEFEVQVPGQWSVELCSAPTLTPVLAKGMSTLTVAPRTTVVLTRTA